MCVLFFTLSLWTQVLFEGEGLSLTQDMTTRSSPFDFSDLQRLSLINGNDYVANVRSRNNLDVFSAYIQHNISMQAEPPSVNGTIEYCFIDIINVWS